MKKILLLACFAITSITVGAQTITYGIDAGVNLFKTANKFELPLLFSITSYSTSSSYKAGFHLGGLIDIKYNSFSIQPGILFAEKGGKSSYSFTGNINGQTINETADSETTLYYIEVPVNFLYRFKTGTGNFFVGAGPYLAIGLSGKGTADVNTNGRIMHVPLGLEFGSSDYDLRNPDIGGNCLIGYELKKGLKISAGYEIGFVSTSKTSNSVYNKNQGFNFSLGYFFK